MEWGSSMHFFVPLTILLNVLTVPWPGIADQHPRSRHFLGNSNTDSP